MLHMCIYMCIRILFCRALLVAAACAACGIRDKRVLLNKRRVKIQSKQSACADSSCCRLRLRLTSRAASSNPIKAVGAPRCVYIYIYIYIYIYTIYIYIYICVIVCVYIYIYIYIYPAHPINVTSRKAKGRKRKTPWEGGRDKFKLHGLLRSVFIISNRQISNWESQILKIVVSVVLYIRCQI